MTPRKKLIAGSLALEAIKVEPAHEKSTRRAGLSAFNTFSDTLIGLAQGLHVRHIATFQLITCTNDDNAVDVFAHYPEFDQIPVKHDGHIIGVFERDGSGQLRPLDDGILVAAEQPLENFLPLMAKPPFYRLVLDGARVNGVVTRSDLLKLPVRVLAFALSTSLETTIKDIISREIPNDADWLRYMSTGRQEKIRVRQAEFKEKRVDPPLLDLTDYSDKYTILLKHYRLGKKFKSDLVKIENIRNAVSHGRSYADDEASLVEFIHALERAQYWIKYLNETYLDEALKQ
jgi:predicted transcriptional regulator